MVASPDGMATAVRRVVTAARARVSLNAARDDVVGGLITMLTPRGSVYSMEVGPNWSIYFSDNDSIYRLLDG
jgi:hypothetical protein